MYKCQSDFMKKPFNRDFAIRISFSAVDIIVKYKSNLSNQSFLVLIKPKINLSIIKWVVKLCSTYCLEYKDNC